MTAPRSLDHVVGSLWHSGRDIAQLPLRLGGTGQNCWLPGRFAQEALGHNSKAVHRAYAKRALMKIPLLEDYEQRAVS